MEKNKIENINLHDLATAACRARVMRALLRPRRLSLRFWIPTTGLRSMHAA